VKIYTTIADLQADLNQVREAGKKIGFVPTMGALHEGHLSLVLDAKSLSDYVVCSIFVNPTQFNDPKDLEKYPRPLSKDIALLQEVGCDVLFMPDVEEMYGEAENWSYDLGLLDQIWEGANRPGHFAGVTQIVYKLFVAVQPDVACFGQKDFQQCMVVAHLIKNKQLPITLHIAPIIREASGLAMSSRNERLTPQARKDAAILYEVLKSAAQQLNSQSLNDIHKDVQHRLAKSPLTLEYFGICQTSDLQPIAIYDDKQDTVLLLAAWIEGVRLIDNLFVPAKQ
jgi:pantoate--beta-alanine ligase